MNDTPADPNAQLAALQRDPTHPLWSAPDALRALFVRVYGTKPVLSGSGVEPPAQEDVPPSPAPPASADPATTEAPLPFAWPPLADGG